MSKLAIFGGSPVIDRALQHYNSVGQKESEAVRKVLESGCLSAFYGSWGDQFFGGPMVQSFEKAWSDHFRVKHSVSVNSATSGLFAAMGAVGIQPGDEVIVPPFTMSATAMAPLIYGGIPVFVDIEPETFCLNPDLVREAITEKTKAILAVNLFGHPARLKELKEIAVENNLKLIEDNAQAPLAEENGKYAGTVGHIGVFSLNYHKHIHTGEGGMCVTNDDELALRLQMIRNHAENMVESLNTTNLVNLIGFNYRMTELSAAVGIEQLKAIDQHVRYRTDIAKILSKGVEGISGLTPPVIRQGCRHVFYLWALKYNEDEIGVSRTLFSEALSAEGFPHFVGYVRPLYLLPIFQKKIAFGNNGYPFNLSKVTYEKGSCPVTERLYEKELICYETCMYSVDSQHLNLFIDAIQKVYEHRHELNKSNQ